MHLSSTTLPLLLATLSLAHPHSSNNPDNEHCKPWCEDNWRFCDRGVSGVKECQFIVCNGQKWGGKPYKDPCKACTFCN